LRIPARGRPAATGSLTASLRKVNVWKVLVPVVALLAGLLCATTARAARGTDLRSSGDANLADLIRSAEGKGDADDAVMHRLQADIADATDLLARSDRTLAGITAKSVPLREPAGLVAVSGPGLTLTLDDAHPAQPPTDPAVANALVVHQSDMQAAANALWAGGAEAIMVMGQRLVATSAIRCVGNTLLLNGRVYSPPFAIAAIGPAGSMRDALSKSTDLRQYREDAESYGLGYDVKTETRIDVPAYDSPLHLSYASVGQ